MIEEIFAPIFRAVFRAVYTLPWPVALLAPAIVLLLRGAAVFLRPRTEKSVTLFRILFPLWLFVFAAFTLLFRTEREMEPVYEAFVYFKKWAASGNPEMVRSFWMNVLLGIPGGLCFAGALRVSDPERPFVSALKRFLPVIPVCFAVSLAAELLQLTRDIGRFETDDLIANTLGGFLGAVPEVGAGFLLAFLRWKPKNRFFAKLVDLANQYWRIVSYIFWGGTTTFVNWLVFFSLDGRIHYLAANGIAWVVSVTYAFVVNRMFVFRSVTRGVAVLKEGLLFAASRVFALGLDTALMWTGVDLLHFSKGLMKVIVAIIVAVVNYIVEKIIVFRKKNEPEYEDF